MPAPADPPCDWCSQRPATRYEVAPPIWGAARQVDQRGRMHGAKVMKKHAIVAYACRHHRETFDRQKQEIAERKERERREIKGGV